jgi:hypothetical protein
MSNVDWDHWLNMPTVELWQAVALSMWIDPDDKNRINHSEGELAQLNIIDDHDKFIKRLTLLKASFFDTNSLRVASVNGSNNAKSVIYLDSFVNWAINKADWDIPPRLYELENTKEKVKNKSKETEQEKTEDKPWNIYREGDSKPEHYQPWYPAARYFAREFVKENSNILKNKKRLCRMTAESLKDVHIYKRGGRKEPFDTETIRKALNNLDYS